MGENIYGSCINKGNVLGLSKKNGSVINKRVKADKYVCLEKIERADV